MGEHVRRPPGAAGPCAVDGNHAGDRRHRSRELELQRSLHAALCTMRVAPPELAARLGGWINRPEFLDVASWVSRGVSVGLGEADEVALTGTVWL
jgi:hypothetical protein